MTVFTRFRAHGKPDAPEAPEPAIADAAGGTVEDVEARAALNDVLAALRALGLIET